MLLALKCSIGCGIAVNNMKTNMITVCCRAEVISILNEVSGKAMPLFKFMEIYEKRYVEL